MYNKKPKGKKYTMRTKKEESEMIKQQEKELGFNLNSAIALLYTNDEEGKDELFWETINEPYKSILEECYDYVEEGKYQSLEQITNNIKYCRLSYIKSGILLYQTKYYKLYKKGYQSFKSYCEREIQYRVWRANQVIESAEVAVKLIKYGFEVIPQNESQARILTKLNNEQLIQKWTEVIDNYKPHEITSNRIEKIVFGEQKKKKGTIKLPIKVIREIENKSLEIGISSADLITKIMTGELIINSDGSLENQTIETEDIIENPHPETLKKWEKDLNKLAFQERNKIDDFAEDLAEEVKNAVTDVKKVIKKCFIKSFLEPLLM